MPLKDENPEVTSFILKGYVLGLTPCHGQKILAMVRIQFIKLYNLINHGFTETFCIMFQDGLTMEINMTFLSVQALILRQLVRVFNTPTSKDWLTL